MRIYINSEGSILFPETWLRKRGRATLTDQTEHLLSRLAISSNEIARHIRARSTPLRDTVKRSADEKQR